MLLGVSGEIDQMGDKLHDLKIFLADADRRNITDESVQEWVGQFKRAMYEAADILDLCQLKAMESGPEPANLGCLNPLLVCMQDYTGCFNPLLFCMRNPFYAHEIGTRIMALNQRLDAIKERSTSFNFINLRSYEDHSSKVDDSLHGNHSRETSGELDRSGVVGEKIKEDTRALVAQILQTRKEVNNNIMVVAIVGVGGIGKTTLAQNVFNDEAIQGKFSKKIWLSVNQNFRDAELLRRVISEAGGDHRLAGGAKATLQRTLKDTLNGHKTLLVMDDVWNHETWERVLKIPLVNAVASGSRVIITTRDEGVARGMIATCPYHQVGILAPDDAWSLLKKQVLSNELDEDHINRLKDIGLKIVQRCSGLPLAVKVMGGLLRKRGGLRRDWEQVLDDSKWSITKMPQELNYAVYLSYEDMPPYLKQCFLYYSLLPKNKKFNVHQVVTMWISEGFVHGNSNDLEELGENYYKELIYRNLIEPDKLDINQSCCSMHDVLRSFAQYMTKEEALIAHDGDNDNLTKLQSERFLRLSIATNRLQSGELDWASLQEQQSVRTLISTTQIKINPGDSLVTFSSLRTLHIEFADVVVLVESLHRLKHLRYLALLDTDISVLPGNIGKMKLLQFLNLGGCEKLVNLPDSIVKLGQLRLLNLPNVSMIPKGFHGLTSMRRLDGYRAHMDGDWCSLDELGPLSQLRFLGLIQLENVSTASFAANARLGEKMHLIDLVLVCTSRLGDDGLVKGEGVSKDEQRRIENVLDELCPPSSVENLVIKGYFGSQLPSWMVSTSMVLLNNLKNLEFSGLACCTQLPNGLCQLPCLQILMVNRAPCIRHVGTGFLLAKTIPFPMLNKMVLHGMVEWQEWEWEEQVQAMPRLEELFLDNCKLTHVPPGLASNARALKKLVIDRVQHLSYLENFPFVVDLRVLRSPDLKRISNFPNLKKLTVTDCPKLKVLESIPVLEWLVLEDYTMEELPEYMPDIKPLHLLLSCRLWLLTSVAMGQSGLEWDKFSHVKHVKAYAHDGNSRRKWYMTYTGDNGKLDSNISRSSIYEETLSSSIVNAQGFAYMYKMRSTFIYICGLVRMSFLEDMIARDHTFIDGGVLSLQDRVVVALVMMKVGESPAIVGSYLGVNESTVLLVTKVFIEAMFQRAMHHLRWPGSSKIEKIKHKFDMIHNLPNCCGIVYTSHVTCGSQNRDNEEDDIVLMQVVVDADMRFLELWVDSDIFESFEKGAWLNGMKLKLPDGSVVGEYIIGDGGYPLRPWLITPYQLENDLSDSDYKLEFNRRHYAATSVALGAMDRLKDTWKCLQGEGLRPNNRRDMCWKFGTCCMLHNIVIEMEGDGAGMPSDQEENCTRQVRQVADEDGVRVRDILAQHLINSGVHTMAAEKEQEAAVAASGSGDENKEQEAHRRVTADRGKQKVHDLG
ncbi:hypothetical protein ACQJBY_072806 [Aegilops geniculata]